MVILRTPVPGLSEMALNRFVNRTARVAGLRGSVNVLVTTNRELRSLNRRFRRRDQATDVLSFSVAPHSARDLAGDVAISADIAARNGKRLGHSAAAEIKVLVLHGVLHLAGYDHERDDGSMARKEAQLRAVLGLPSGLTERNGSSGGRQTLSKSSRRIEHSRNQGKTDQGHRATAPRRAR